MKQEPTYLGDCIGCIDAETHKKDKTIPVLLVWVPALQETNECIMSWLLGQKYHARELCHTWTSRGLHLLRQQPGSASKDYD